MEPNRSNDIRDPKLQEIPMSIYNTEKLEINKNRVYYFSNATEMNSTATPFDLGLTGFICMTILMVWGM